MSATKITYVNLTADNEEIHGKLDAAATRVRASLGQKTPLVIGGRERFTDAVITSTSPNDTRLVVSQASSATTEDVQAAVAAAKEAWPAWRKTPWRARADLVEKTATIVRENVHEMAVLLSLEMGKNRVEALGEIEEVADLYSYYASQMRANDGFVKPMDKLSPADTNTSVLRPYGVWVVISPWNFPSALLGAPAAAALLAGNTVILKPSSETPMAGWKIMEAFQKAGFPPGVVSMVTGSGRVAGDALALHPDVAGVTFTGSYDVGFHKLYQRFSTRYPKPCIVEMGGKNPAIVMDTADLERAVMGVYRSAFGMGGQKCSACSRVYVHEAIADRFIEQLVAKAESTKIGDPLARDTFLGPVGTRAGYEDYQRYAEHAQKDGRILAGGKVLRDGAFAQGLFVQPTVFTDLPQTHPLVKEELFLPMLYLDRIKSLDEGIAKANDTDLGLTAGFFSGKQAEVDEFLDRIEAGVVYVNRAAGATTGAWPGVQPFGGWKGSGSTGKNIGGLYTVQCYLREQSRTVTG